MLISSNITINKGQSAELSCTVTGNPPPEVAWFRNGEKIKTSRIVKDCKQLQSGFYEMEREEVSNGEKWRTRLLVCSANYLDHTGSYTCQATNSEGNASGVTYLNILGKYIKGAKHNSSLKSSRP